MTRVRNFLSDVGVVFVMDVVELFRKPALLAGLVISPFAILLLFGFVFPNIQVPQDVPFGIAVADDDPSGEADAFVTRLLATNERLGAFAFTEYASEEEARRAVERKDVHGFILVPDGFTDARRHGGYAASVIVYWDQGNPGFGRLVASQAELLVKTVSAEEGEENVRTVTHLGSEEAARALMDPYATERRSLTNVPPSYFQFLVPGLIMLATMTSMLLGTPNSLAREKDGGTLDAIFASPVSRAGFLWGKLAAASARGLTQVAITTTVGVLFFGVSLGGSLHLVLFLVVLSLLSFAGIALALVTFVTPTKDGARGYRLMVAMPMMFLSGIFFPVEQLPAVVQPVSKILPLTYGVAAMRRVVITGADLSGIAFEVGLLAAITVAGFALAIPLVKRYNPTA